MRLPSTKTFPTRLATMAVALGALTGLAQAQDMAPAPPAAPTAQGQSYGQPGDPNTGQNADPNLVAPSMHPAAESTPLPARLSDVEGSVTVTQTATSQNSASGGSSGNSTGQAGIPPPPPADEVSQQATVNMPVLAGMQVATAGDGRAELQFDDGSVARVTPQSAVQLVAIQGSGSSSGEQLRAVRGLTYFELPDGALSVMTVQAGPDRIRLGRNTLVRVDMDGTPYKVAVIRGSAHFNNRASDIGFEVTAGNTATLNPASPSDYDVEQDLAANSWDAWNTDRDTSAAELASGETNARVGNGDADSAGWDDLDYYGTWYDVPGAGMAWSPDGADANFDPYGTGAWNYYSGVGYTWVSPYPWGWLPYHCGGWSYFNNFGYMWQPGGGCGGYGGVGWYPYTGIHGAPGGYQLPGHPQSPLFRSRLGGAVLPRSQPLVRVNRSNAFQFRELGGTRPEPREMPLRDSGLIEGESAYAPMLPVVASPRLQQYRQPVGALPVGGRIVSSGSNLAQSVQGGRPAFTPGLAPGPDAGRTIRSPYVLGPSRVPTVPSGPSAPARTYQPAAPRATAPAVHSTPAPAATGHH